MTRQGPEIPLQPIDLTGLLPDGPIERIIEKYRRGEEPSEVEQWSRFTPNERLAAMIEMRARYLRWRYGIEPQLERVLAVTRKA